ncbi:hypothetical protein EVU96_25030 [Bacillus infantis]|uniref:hypothetical protein n=1 Tax=Bacillus infantis TaxID=324767 RepID=UPI00101BE12F|nr:hypothetical protein [Bacillus infantis]RYI25080.1 hypothetical protein EVU96_25030 [Bacillus infantis]
MKLEEFGLYELKQYADAAFEHAGLVLERDTLIQALYDDISPTMVSIDYNTGEAYTVSYHPETTAINIISVKDRFQKMIDKVERKARLFGAAMENLTDRERDVIQVCYHYRKNDLGLSPQYFYQVLGSAQQKLCSFLQEAREEHVQAYMANRKAELRQKIQAS